MSRRPKCRRCSKALGSTKPVCHECLTTVRSATGYLFETVLGGGDS